MRAAPSKRDNFADATCPMCNGAGQRYVLAKDQYSQQTCDCTLQNYALQQLHDLFGPVEFERVGENGLERWGRCRWITGLTTEHASREIAAPLYELFLAKRRRCQPLNVRLLTDQDIREAYFMPSRHSKDGESRTELDKLVPPSPGLVILLLGYAHKHAANGTSLAEYLAKLRGTKVQWGTPVWICDSLWKPYDSKHPAYHEDVAHLLANRFGRIELCDPADILDVASVAAL